MKKRTSQRGSLPLVIMIIVLLLAGVGLAGWYVWQKRDKVNHQAITNQRTEEGVKKEGADAPPSPAQNSKYLVIKEWGVKVPLPEQLLGEVEYGIFILNNGDQVAYFASKKIAAKSTDNTCGLTYMEDETGKGMFGGVISLSRQKEEPQILPEDSRFRYGEFWYEVDFSNGGTCYEGDTGQETGELKSLMSESVRKLESI